MEGGGGWSPGQEATVPWGARQGKYFASKMKSEAPEVRNVEKGSGARSFIYERSGTEKESRYFIYERSGTEEEP